MSAHEQAGGTNRRAMLDGARVGAYSPRDGGNWMSLLPKRSSPVIFTAAALVLGVASAVGSASPTEPWPPRGVSFHGDPAVPDLSGVWLGSAFGIPGQGAQTNSGKSSDGRPPAYWAPWPLPYTAEYQRITEERKAARSKGVTLGDTGSRCLPFGMPWQVSSKVYPDEIVQTPGEVTIFLYNQQPLIIWTDGREHPKDLAPSYYGHSIGHWEGDTLAVDTVGIRENTPMDSSYDPHSADLHMTWTIRRVAPDALHVQVTLFDDKAFTEPVAMTNIWHRQTTRKWEVLDDSSCFESATGVSSAKPPADGFIKF